MSGRCQWVPRGSRGGRCEGSEVTYVFTCGKVAAPSHLQKTSTWFVHYDSAGVDARCTCRHSRARWHGLGDSMHVRTPTYHPPLVLPQTPQEKPRRPDGRGTTGRLQDRLFTMAHLPGVWEKGMADSGIRNNERDPSTLPPSISGEEMVLGRLCLQLT